MAMPPETPIPCRTKLTPPLYPQAAAAASTSLAFFPEPIVDELNHRGHRGSLVRTRGLQADGSAHARGEHHDSKDIACVRAPTVEHEGNAASKARRKLHDLGRSARVQSKAIPDSDFLCLHDRKDS